MRSIIISVSLLFLPFLTMAQEKYADSLKEVFRSTATDSVRYTAGRALYYYYEEQNRDSALYFAEQNLLLAKKNNKKLAEAASLDIKAYQLMHQGKYAPSLQCLLLAFKILEGVAGNQEETWPVVTIEPSPGKSKLLILTITHHMFGILMEQTQNVKQQIFHFKEALRIAKEIGNANRHLLAAMNLGSSYLMVDKPDSALVFAMEAYRISKEASLYKYRGISFLLLATCIKKRGTRHWLKNTITKDCGRHRNREI